MKTSLIITAIILIILVILFFREMQKPLKTEMKKMRQASDYEIRMRFRIAYIRVKMNSFFRKVFNIKYKG
jgi:hypothetical protein